MGRAESSRGPIVTSGGCCGERGCRRTEPIGLALGSLTGCVVYAVMSKRLVRDNGDGSALFAMGARHDVTDQMRRFIRANPEWVKGVLEGADSGG